VSATLHDAALRCESNPPGVRAAVVALSFVAPRVDSSSTRCFAGKKQTASCLSKMRQRGPALVASQRVRVIPVLVSLS
ncbi:MAG: hypothetical protein NWT06_02035, partial [OM182 bacterium]|nr:hypothetical protein [OM182 bacterium]